MNEEAKEDIKRTQLMAYVYATLSQICDNDETKAWNLLDVRKIGIVELEDMRKAFINTKKIFLTKQELAIIF